MHGLSWLSTVDICGLIGDPVYEILSFSDANNWLSITDFLYQRMLVWYHHFDFFHPIWDLIDT